MKRLYYKKWFARQSYLFREKDKDITIDRVEVEGNLWELSFQTEKAIKLSYASKFGINEKWAPKSALIVCEENDSEAYEALNSFDKKEECLKMVNEFLETCNYADRDYLNKKVKFDRIRV